MGYVDAMIAPVPTTNKEAYRTRAQALAALFLENGATTVTECWGDAVPDGKLTSMPMAVKLEPDETIVLSWIFWPSKAVRDAGWPKIMADPSMQGAGGGDLFDGKRLIYGAFDVLTQSP